jgi:hypothetical protein
MAAGRKKSRGAHAAKTQADGAVVETNGALETGGKFVGEWNRLVSTTNWEKGRIICQWRDALTDAGAPATDYSDETWSQLVGRVTSQHVGRLRRVFQRFGDVFHQYEGLYWSHFQASLDWDDAEMWLEGAIHNGWSVSQMRGKRWETLGTPGEPPPAEDASANGELDEEAPWSGDQASNDARSGAAAVKPVAAPAKPQAAGKVRDDGPRDQPLNGDGDQSPKLPAKSRGRLSVDVDELPEDLADAFEQFKLAIIAQRRLAWSETTPEAVLECLDALRELALAPLDD